MVAYLVIAIINEPATKQGVTDTMEIVGLALLIVAMIGRIWSALYLTGRKSKVLCIAGPFSLSRNPLYFFSFLGAIGIGLLTGSFVLLVVLVLTFLLYYHFVIKHEEARLSEIFGEPFEDYKRRVPRLIPWRFREYERTEELTVKTKPFMQVVIDTSCFLWAFFALEASEALSNGFGWALHSSLHLP